jgi:hypothetical protein
MQQWMQQWRDTGHEEPSEDTIDHAVAHSPRVVGLDGADVAVAFDGQDLVVTWDPRGEATVCRYRPLAPGEAPRPWASVHYYGHVWNLVSETNPFGGESA